jgi:mono/diheme cytochrome c family protein
VFTVEQASRGQTAYAQSCSKCHQPLLGGADDSPALTGASFLGSWDGQTLGELHNRIRTSMPPDDPGSYGRQHITDVIAYLLSVNGFPAGKALLPIEQEALQEVRIVAVRP